MTDEATHLRLAGVTRLSLLGRGPKDAFVFDPHRLALPCWALALAETRGALLVTLDRHLDLVRPAHPGQVPDASAGVRALDEHARWNLDVRNYDHILAAMEAGLVGDVVVVGRARPAGTWSGDEYLDTRGRSHALVTTPTVERLCDGFQTGAPGPVAARLEALLERPGPVLLDVDLDCFTTPSDADPTTLVPWPQETIRAFLRPEGSAELWRALLERTVALTIAREPYHCGGMVAAGRLFEDLAQVLFVELLGVDLP